MIDPTEPGSLPGKRNWARTICVAPAMAQHHHVVLVDSSMECAAYYQVTVNALRRDADEEVADRYRERASLNLEAALSGQSIPEMEQAMGMRAARLEAGLARNGEDLGDLASRYDDKCVGLFDE